MSSPLHIPPCLALPWREQYTYMIGLIEGDHRLKMVRNGNLHVSVPTFFRCPISLDVMKSPVSLCTGVTYDRSSIQAWLDTGHNTCPATMQVLPSTDFVPNLTLHRLIQLWSAPSSSSDVHDSVSDSCSSSTSSNSSPAFLTTDAALLLLRRLPLDDPDPASSFPHLHRFVKDCDRNRQLFARNGCVRLVAGFLSNSGQRKVETVEGGLRLLRLVLGEDRIVEDDEKELMMGSGFWSALLLGLQKGNLDCRVDSAKLIESILGSAGGSDGDEKRKAKAVLENTEGILYELLRLAGWESDTVSVDAGLSAMVAMAAAARAVRAQISKQGGVGLLGRLLGRPEPAVVGKALVLLEAVSACPEGRAAMAADQACIPAMVGRVMKTSEAATERAVVVLWSLCCAYRDEAARERVAGSNAAAKMLLLLQSNCAPAVRQMAGDLLKVVRLAGGAEGCLTSYDTKTTHIMPF